MEPPLDPPAAVAEPVVAAQAARTRTPVAAAGLVVVIALMIQTGSALAARLIDSVGVFAALWLRTAIAAAVLAAVRPRSLRLPGRGDRLPLLWLTLSLLVMNLSFFAAIARTPIGIVVAIEFLGPLAIAVAGSRRPLDFVWIVLAGGGVFVLAGPSGSVDTLGLLFSLLAGAGWAAFLLTAKRAVTTMPPLTATTLMLACSAVLLTPALAFTGGRIAADPSAIWLGVAVALLSSAIPYVLELFALSFVRAATYGVLLSIEPGIAALTGFLILDQRLTLLECAAIAAVAIAAAGASWFDRDVRARRRAKAQASS
jgi:inner membrane transporter RhtA